MVVLTRPAPVRMACGACASKGAVIPAARAWICLPASRGAPRAGQGPVKHLAGDSGVAGRCGPDPFPLPPQPVNPRAPSGRFSRVRTLSPSVPDWAGHSAGQHVDIRLTAHDDYQAERAYSIASAPGEPLAVTVEWLDDGEVSPCLAEEARTGELLEVRGPIGSYFVWEPGSGGPPLGGRRFGRRATAGRPAAPFAGRKPGPAAAAVVLAELGWTGRCWPRSRGRPRTGRCPTSADRRASRGPSRPAWSRWDIRRSGSGPNGSARPGSEGRQAPWTITLRTVMRSAGC